MVLTYNLSFGCSGLPQFIRNSPYLKQLFAFYHSQVRIWIRYLKCLFFLDQLLDSYSPASLDVLWMEKYRNLRCMYKRDSRAIHDPQFGFSSHHISKDGGFKKHCKISSQREKKWDNITICQCKRISDIWECDVK